MSETIKMEYSNMSESLVQGVKPFLSSSFCVQQGNQHYQQQKPYDNSSNNASRAMENRIDVEEQIKRDQNIQMTANRLRQKLLENRFETLMSHLVELASKLEVIKLETTISLNSLQNDASVSLLDHFEKRFENHQLELKNALTVTSESKIFLWQQQQQQKQQNSQNSTISDISSFSKLNLSPTFSSVISYCSSSEEQEISLNPSTGTNKQRKDTSSTSTSTSCPDSPLPTKNVLNNYCKPPFEESTIHPLELMCKKPSCHATTATATSSSCSSDTGMKSGRSFVSHFLNKELLEKRNVFDDTMSYLDQLEYTSNDSRFREDILSILDNMHFNNVKAQSLKQKSTSITAASKCRQSFVRRTASRILLFTWGWIRFFLVMFLAVLINIKRGPGSFNKKSFNSHNSMFSNVK